MPSPRLKPEDLAPLVEQMARVTALAAGRRGKLLSPVDLQTPLLRAPTAALDGDVPDGATADRATS